MTWYLDCYSHNAICGKEFPVNSYYCNDLYDLLSSAKRILLSKNSGVDEVRISLNTKGQNPISIYE